MSVDVHKIFKVISDSPAYVKHYKFMCMHLYDAMEEGTISQYEREVCSKAIFQFIGHEVFLIDFIRTYINAKEITLIYEDEFLICKAIYQDWDNRQLTLDKTKAIFDSLN